MKNLLLAVVVLVLIFGVNTTSMAAGKMSLSVGADVLLPMGTFGDAVGIGFGGSARGQYDITPMFSVGLTVGYYTWSGKDFSRGGINVKGPSFSGIPIRVFGKYYFIPEGAARVYGIGELGFFIGKGGDVTIPAQNIGGFVIPEQTVAGQSSTDFNYAPGLGVEFPLGSGNTKMDVSVRYDGIATSGGSSGSIGARVGVNFGLGN